MDGMKIIREKFVPLIQSYIDLCWKDSYNHKIVVDSVDVEESKLGNDEYSDYMKAGATKDAMVRFNYRVLTKDTGKVEHVDSKNPKGVMTAEFYIPVTLHDLFILDGKVRAPMNYVDNARSCVRYGDSSLAINDCLSLNFDTNTIGYASSGNYYERETIPLDELHKIPAEVLKLSDEEGRRLFLQYSQLNAIPKKLTKELFEDLRVKSTLNRDHIAFKKLISVYDTLYMHLTQWTTRHKILMKSSSQFYKYLKYYPSSIQTAINQFFKGQSDYLLGLSNMSNTNPATYKTLANKLILEKYSAGASGIIKPTDYNESLSLLVDPSMTPDSANVNRVNEMNHAITYDGFTTYVLVLNLNTKSFTKLELLEYLTTPILSADDVDYRTKEPRKLRNASDSYTIKYRNDNNKKLSYDEFTKMKIKYADSPSDERLSASTRMIPNLNFSDSVRTSMGSRMLNQAIEIAYPEAPIVSTGHTDFADSSLFITSPESGIVKEIKDDELIITDNKGNDISVKLPENMNAQYCIDVSFKLLVKPGDKVHVGTKLVRPLGIAEDGSPLLGRNAFVAFANYKGYTYEDGVVISESFSNKLTHTYILDVDSYIFDTDKLTGITGIGTPVNSLDKLATITRLKSPSAQVRGIIDIFMPSEDDAAMDYDASVVTPNNIYEGYLVDVNYSEGGGTNEKAKKLLDDYIHDYRKATLPFDYFYNRLRPDPKEPNEKWAMKVTFRLVVRSKARVGDKISNRYGSKGVITLVLPDSEMWRTKDGRIIDCIMNPFAVVSRKNVSQTMEAGLSILAEKVWKKVKPELSNVSKVRSILSEYKFDSYLELSDKKLIERLNKDGKLYYVTGCYGKITPKEIAKMLGKSGLNDGRITIFKPDGKPLRQPVVCGYQYMIKLLFLVSYINKVTSDSYDLDESMILGMGAEKDSGQSLEEMIFWGLQSHGALKAIDEFRSSTGKTSEYWLRAHCLAAGLDLSIKASDDE